MSDDEKSVRIMAEGYIKADSVPLALYQLKFQQLDDMTINNHIARSHAKQLASELASSHISCLVLGKKNAILDETNNRLMTVVNELRNERDELMQELEKQREICAGYLVAIERMQGKSQAKGKRRRR